MKGRMLLILIAAALAGWYGCSHGSLSLSTANLRVFLTDAPLDLSTVSAVNVTVTEFVLYETDDEGTGEEGGILLDMPAAGSETINLLDYQQGAVTLVASGEIPEGTYSRIRLRISSAELVHDDDGDPDTPDVSEPIFISSGKVDVPVPFTVSAGEEMDVVLDFDAERSVQVNGTQGQHSYILRPVITPVSMNGS